MNDILSNWADPQKKKNDKNESILNELLEICQKHELKKDYVNDIKFFLNMAYLRITKSTDEEAKFYYIRRLFLDISNTIRFQTKNPNVDWLGLSDILYFYSVTF
mmetsp:Transcript_13251/g.11337  ORF Transcript_13251/g.11337 Transcript_13251/m.11337 type:complete len:104 (-) Transcript_13251:534-845(-)